MRIFNHFLTIRYLSKSFLILSYPKSGNTYLRLLLGNYILAQNGLPAISSFDQLNNYMPELGKYNTFKNNLQLHGKRIVKSHHAFYSGFARFIVVHRPFIEVFSSYLAYSKARDIHFHEQKKLQSIKLFVQTIDPRHGVYLDYRTLIDHPETQVSRLLYFLGEKSICKSSLAVAIDASRKEEIKRWSNENGIKFIQKYRQTTISEQHVEILCDLDNQLKGKFQ